MPQERERIEAERFEKSGVLSERTAPRFSAQGVHFERGGEKAASGTTTNVHKIA